MPQPDRAHARNRVLPGAVAAVLERRRRGRARCSTTRRLFRRISELNPDAHVTAVTGCGPLGRNAAFAAPRASRLRPAPGWGRVTPMPPFPQRYNDGFRGWPVRPHDRQHPVRGPSTRVLIPSWADLPHRCRHCCSRRPPRAGRPPPAARTASTRSRAASSNRRPERACGNVRVRHFGYGHVDARVEPGERVRPGQLIGWTCRGWWHLHLTEWFSTGDGGRLLLNPLRPAGKLKLFADIAPPVIHEVRSTRRPNRAGPGERGTPPACRPRAAGLTGRGSPASSTSAPASAILSRSSAGSRTFRARRAPPPVPARALALEQASRGLCCDERCSSPDGTLVPRGPALRTRTTQTRRRRSASTVVAAATASTGSGPPAPVLGHHPASQRPLPARRSGLDAAGTARVASWRSGSPTCRCDGAPAWAGAPLKLGPIPALSHAEVVPRRVAEPRIDAVRLLRRLCGTRTPRSFSSS